MVDKMKKAAAMAGIISMSFAGFMPIIANAAVVNPFLTVDGGTSVEIQEGNSVELKYTYDTTSSTDVESLGVSLISDGVVIGLPQQCINIANSATNGTHNRTFTLDTNGALQGEWDVVINKYGVNGPGVSNACNPAHVIGAPNTFTDRITVTEEDGTSGGGSTSAFERWFCGRFPSFCSTPPTTPPPATNPKCDLIRPYRSAPPYTYSSTGVQLQSVLLLDNPNSIPLLAAGSKVRMGYFGTQTHAALATYDATHRCN